MKSRLSSLRASSLRASPQSGYARPTLSLWLLVTSALLMLGGTYSLISSMRPGWTSAKMNPAGQPAGHVQTATPFQPQTQTPVPTWIAPAEAIPSPVTPQPLPPAPHFAQKLFDFPAPKTRLLLFPDQRVNGGNPIEMAFYPAPDCLFGSGKGCISLHRSGRVVLLTIHSGVGGEGEAFRQAVESTSIYGAGFTLDQIQANLAALQNTPGHLSLGGEDLVELELVALARVPAADLQPYFDLPYDEALEMVARQNDRVRLALDSGADLLAFEICGWYVGGEAWGSESSPTTASIYLGLMRARQR